MARRGGRSGDYLATDEYYGKTVLASTLKKDFWGAYAVKPLLRNLQEIAMPLGDPYPVEIYTGSSYEKTPTCVAEVAPTFVGNTTVPTSKQNLAFQVLDLDPTLGQMAVGCNFVIR